VSFLLAGREAAFSSCLNREAQSRVGFTSLFYYFFEHSVTDPVFYIELGLVQVDLLAGLA